MKTFSSFSKNTTFFSFFFRDQIIEMTRLFLFCFDQKRVTIKTAGVKLNIQAINYID